jgi:hypothetical protein
MKSAKEKIPIVLAFNILKNYYREYGASVYLPIRDHITKLGFDFELLPIITQNYRSTIETRARTIEENLPKVKFKELNCFFLRF